MSSGKRKLIQYPIDMADRTARLQGVMKTKRQMLYITIRDSYGREPAWYLRYRLTEQAKRIHKIVRELYE
uniref:Uncharacterized protein n=1 Tax=viral metagenome TaxID=1070528 RepID=A0A6H1ZGR9_9ZZZZ